MRSRFSKYFLFLLFVSAFSGCKKDDVEFAIEPEIEFVTITPASAMQYSDAVTITIKYEDGDGDLGENKDGIKNCFVTDNRLGITSEYRIKQLAPSNTSIPISGYLNIDIGGQIMTDSSSSQSVTYSVRIVDRAGHSSNAITTGGITIHR